MRNYKLILRLLTYRLVTVLCCLTILSISATVMSLVDNDIELIDLEVEKDTSEKEGFEENDFEVKKIVLDFRRYTNSSFLNKHTKNNYYIKIVIKEITKDIPSPPPDFS